jgi:8-oxo-dGTP diphosphatase
MGKTQVSTGPGNPKGKGYLPGLAIDTVIFGFHDEQLKVLLLEYKQTGLFALPGGFILENENLDDAARRVLEARTGLTDIFLKQFHTFGDLSRFDPRPMSAILDATGVVHDAHHWLLQRFISVGYYALVDFTEVTPMPDQVSDSCRWYALDEIPQLMQDHNQIIAKALDTLSTNLDHTLVGFNLLSEEFTLGELQKLYETILGRKLLRPAFQRKMLSLGILERIAKKWTGGAHKAPYLYKFR